MCDDCGLWEVMRWGPFSEGIKRGAPVTLQPGYPADTWCYVLLDPRDEVRIGYVGQSKEPFRRFVDHLTDALYLSLGVVPRGRSQKAGWHPVPRDGWLMELFDLNLLPRLLILEDVLHVERFKKEGDWRKHWRDSGWTLMNREGFTPDARERQRESARNRVVGTEERAQRSRNKREWWANLPPNEYEAISKKLTGRKLSPEHVDKFLEAAHTPEAESKKSVAMKKSWAERKAKGETTWIQEMVCERCGRVIRGGSWTLRQHQESARCAPKTKGTQG